MDKVENFMDVLAKFNSQTAGRDRFFRLLQYSSKFAGWMLENWKNKDSVAKLKNLECTLAAFRKLLRFGRTFDAFYGAMGTMSIPDMTLRSTIALGRLNFALYLLADHISWLKSMGLVNANQSKWNTLSNKFWLYNIVMNLIRDAYEISQILSTASGLSSFDIDTSNTSPTNMIIAIARGLAIWIKDHKEVTVDTIKNTCDFWLPYSALGHGEFSSGLIGILGVISSVAAILPLIDSSYKLVPTS